MTGYVKVIVVAVACAAAAARATEEEEPLGPESYVGPDLWPACYVYAGVTNGLTYDAAADLTGRARYYGAPGTLADVGATPSFGVAFDYFFFRGLAAELKLLHEFGPRRPMNLKYEVASFPKTGPFLPEGKVEERLAYQMQNVDLKAALKYVFFLDYVATPYVGAAWGINSTLMKVEDRTSDPVVEKYGDGLLLADGWFQRFSFDWAAYAGAEVHLGDNFSAVAEYVYDRSLGRHYIAGYRYDTRLQGWLAGVGWRFR